MRTPFVRAVVVASAFVVVGAACSDDTPAAPAPASIGSPVTITSPTLVVTTTVNTPATTASTVPLTRDTVDIPINIPPPPDTSDAPIVISVTIGIDADPGRVENIPLGATVSLSVTNPAAADEFHLHGYDLGDGTAMPKGQTETFTFTASQPGQFELESHTTTAVLLVLNVG
jgi:hypothetical protein